MSKVFVSYRHVAPDQDLAHHICICLQKRGHEPFIDTRLNVGQRWPEELDGQLRSSKFLLVLLSKNSITSDMVREEVCRAPRMDRVLSAGMRKSEAVALGTQSAHVLGLIYPH
jgi:hypothetical protein